MTDTVATICEILSANPTSNATERLELATIIADAIGRNPSMEAPRGGVLIYFRKGNGRSDLTVKTDPPSDDHQTNMGRAVAELSGAIMGFDDLVAK